MMKRSLLAAFVAAVACAGMAAPLQAGSAFGHFYSGRYCSSCSICFRPYNAFTPCGPGGCGMGGCGHGCGHGFAGYYFGDCATYGVIPPSSCGFGCDVGGWGMGHGGWKAHRRASIFPGGLGGGSMGGCADGFCGGDCGDCFAPAKTGLWHSLKHKLKKRRGWSGDTVCDGCGVPGDIISSTPDVGCETSGETLGSHSPAPSAPAQPAPANPAPATPGLPQPKLTPVPANPISGMPPRMQPVSYQYGVPAMGYPMGTPAYGNYGPPGNYGYYPAYGMPAYGMPTYPMPWQAPTWYPMGW